MTDQSSGSQPATNHPAVMGEEKTVISRLPVATPRDFLQQLPLAELATTLEGTMLDHFAVVQLIGGGGMGAVFRGIDRRLDRVVAIKVVPAAKRDPGMLRRFRLEAQAAARLDHPNIARVFYIGEANQWDYIVFEFIDGVNVRDLVELEGPLTLDDAVFYTRQIAEALQHAHEREVVHRDIKPSNILVTATGTAKLVDMGLARDTSLEQSTHDRTASGVTLGTFDYISPEQAKNPRDADVRSDLYSLGCSLFFMLTGHPPFPEGTALQKLLNHGSLPPPDPRGWRDDLPLEICQIVSKLMAKRPSDRYQKPIDLVNDLLLLAELDGLPRSQSPTTFGLIPTVAQPTMIETYFPWLLAALLFMSSAIWLHSETTSSGFALPPIQYPASRPEFLAPEPTNSSEAVAKSVSPPASPQGLASPTKGEAPFSTGASNHGDHPQPAYADDPSTSPRIVTEPNPTLLPGSYSEVAEPTGATSSPMQPLSVSVYGTQPSNGSSTSDSSAASFFPLPNFALPGDGEESSDLSSRRDPSILYGSSARTDTAPSTPLSSVGESVPFSNLDSSEPDGDDSSSEKSIELPIIVVSNSPPPDISPQFWESSLHRAVQRLTELPVSGVIEVRGSVWLDRPLSLIAAASDLNSKRLIIRGPRDAPAKIEVARGVWSSVKEDEGLIQVHGTRLSLQNISFQSTFTGIQSLPLSIFQLSGDSTFEASNSTFTVHSERLNQTHLVAISDRQNLRALNSVHPVDTSTINVLFSNCFIRGDFSVLKIVQTDPSGRNSLQVSVDNSLLTVNGRFADVQCATGQRGIDRIIRMFCQWSTFVCAEGFASLTYQGSLSPLVGLSRTAQACVFCSLPGVAHVSLEGDTIDMNGNPDLLYFQGINNSYEQDTLTLCQIRQPGQPSRDIGYNEGFQQGWFTERSNERTIRWANPLLSPSNFSDSKASDFLLAPTHFVPGFRMPHNSP